MFYTAISKTTFDEIMTMFFKNLGIVDPSIDLRITSLEIQGEEVIVEADVDMETIN